MACGILGVHAPPLAPRPLQLHWKHGVPTTGSSGKSLAWDLKAEKLDSSAMQHEWNYCPTAEPRGTLVLIAKLVDIQLWEGR